MFLPLNPRKRTTGESRAAQRKPAFWGIPTNFASPSQNCVREGSDRLNDTFVLFVDTMMQQVLRVDFLLCLVVSVLFVIVTSDFF